MGDRVPCLNAVVDQPLNRRLYESPQQGNCVAASSVQCDESLDNNSMDKREGESGKVVGGKFEDKFKFWKDRTGAQSTPTSPVTPMMQAKMENAELREKCDRLEQQLTELRREKEQHEETMARLEQELQQYKRTSMAAEQKHQAKVEMMHKQVESMKEEMQQKQQQISQLAAKAAHLQLQKRLMADMAAAATASAREKQAVICSLQQQGEQHRAQLSASTADLEAVRNIVAELYQQLHLAVATAAAADAMADKLANDLAMAQDSNASCQADLKQQVAAVNLQLRAAHQHSQGLEGELEKARLNEYLIEKNVDHLTEQLEETKGELETVNGRVSDLTTLLEERQQMVSGLQEQLKHVNADLQDAYKLADDHQEGQSLSSIVRGLKEQCRRKEEMLADQSRSYQQLQSLHDEMFREIEAAVSWGQQEHIR